MTDPSDDDFDIECPVCGSCGELGCGCSGDCDPKAEGCRHGETLAQQRQAEAESLAAWEKEHPE